GGAEFFNAILVERGCLPSATAARPPERRGSEFFVCGSVSESTRAFLDLCRATGVPVFGVPQEIACAADLSSGASERLADSVSGAFDRHHRVVLALELPPLSRGLGPVLATRLAEVALATLRRVPAAEVFAEGGATAACLVRCAGWQRLAVAHEYAQGVVATLTGDKSARRFTIKPGSYVWPKTITELMNQ